MLPIRDKLVITYTGKLILNRHDPELLLRSIKNLADKKLIELNDFIIEFYGPYVQWFDNEIKKYDLVNHVYYKGMISRIRGFKKTTRNSIIIVFKLE